MPDAIPKLKIVYRDPAALVEYERNSRTHSPAQIEQLKQSIRVYGFTNPILLMGDNKTIGAGHARATAARELSLKQVPTITLAGLSETEWRAYVIADNQLALNAGWDMSVLAEELRALKTADFDLTSIGFDNKQLISFLADKNGFTGADELPEQPAPISQPGDLWLLGKHRIICGSSTDADTVAILLGDERPNLMVTDPPYGVKYDASWRKEAGMGSTGTAVGKVLNDDRSDWREAWELFPGNVAYVWHAGTFAGSVAASLEAHKFAIRAQIVWVKPRLVLSRGDYHHQHEPCFYGVREGAEEDWHFEPEHEIATYSVRKGERGDYIGGRKQSTVWNIEHVKSDTGHSTQKPIACMRRPIENNSQPGDAIYEPFSGSGTTIIACQQTARRCFAIELSGGYVDLAVRRWAEFTGQEPVLHRTGQTWDEVAAERLPRSTPDTASSEG